VAEYFGLIAALDYAQNHGIRALRIESDSELMVKQMRGQYKVKSAEFEAASLSERRRCRRPSNRSVSATFIASRTKKRMPW